MLNYSTVELIQSNACDDMVAMAAWVSNGQNEDFRLRNRDKVRGLINFLIREKHTSPFEHGQFTFRIETPIFVVREWHRHRTQSYNEVSGRYTTLKPKFYTPPPERPVIQSGKIGSYKFEAGDDWMNNYLNVDDKEVAQYLWDKYQTRLRIGFANEIARIILPLNIYTEFYATVNPLNLMRFLNSRSESEDGDAQALYEIRQAAMQAESYLQKQMPITYEAWKTHGL